MWVTGIQVTIQVTVTVLITVVGPAKIPHPLSVMQPGLPVPGNGWQPFEWLVVSRWGKISVAGKWTESPIRLLA